MATPRDVFDREFGRFDPVTAASQGDPVMSGLGDQDRLRLMTMCQRLWLLPSQVALDHAASDFAQKWLWKPVYADVYDDSGDVNAIAFEHDDYGLIGSSRALVFKLFFLFLNLLQHPDVLPELGPDAATVHPDLTGLTFCGFPSSERRGFYALNLYTFAASFVFWHELQHLMRGHALFLDHCLEREVVHPRRLLEFESSRPSIDESHLRQLVEIDADTRGGAMALVYSANPELWHGGPDVFGEAKEFAYSWSFAVAITVLYFSTFESGLNWRNRSHPPAPMRIDSVFTSICANHESIAGNVSLPIGNLDGVLLREQSSRAFTDALRLWGELGICGGFADHTMLLDDSAEIVAYYQHLQTRAAGPLNRELAPFKRLDKRSLENAVATEVSEEEAAMDTARSDAAASASLPVRPLQPLGDRSNISSLFDAYPSIRNLVCERLSAMWYGIRLLMAFPTPEIDYNFEFETATALCNLISGASVVLFDADLAGEVARNPRRSRPVNVPSDPVRRNELCYKVIFNDRDKFVFFLKAYWPWQHDEGGWESDGDRLYEWLRCKNVHTLGLAESNKVTSKKIKSVASTNDLLLQKSAVHYPLSHIETASERPPDFPPLLLDSDRDTTISVETLYWGTFQALVRLSNDSLQMRDADARLRAGQYHAIC